jgi:hypothetical protein
MKRIIQDENGNKMVMSVVTSLPTLPENWTDLGLADDLPDAIAEIEIAKQAEQLKTVAKEFLSNTDWQVMRHRDQVDSGLATSLTAEEFAQLLTDRQAARDAI